MLWDIVLMKIKKQIISYLFLLKCIELKGIRECFNYCNQSIK